MTGPSRQIIPKAIHYCWFSAERFPPLVARCIESWHRHMPEWSFVLWKTVPDALPFAQMLAARKRYVFASDYVRFYAIWQHGGIYLDVDMEVVRPFDPVLHNRQFLGYEEQGRINSSVCGGVAGAEFFRACLDAMDRQAARSVLCCRLSFAHTLRTHRHSLTLRSTRCIFSIPIIPTTERAISGS